MATVRRITIVVIAALISAAALIGPAAAQSEHREREVHGTVIELGYRFGAARFAGAIASEFTADNPEAPGCLDGRRVTVKFRRADGSRRLVGTTFTDESGSFRLRASLRKGVYFATVDVTEFAYSPSYGRVVEVVCTAASARMRSTRTRVLGLRIERGATAAGSLPATGSAPREAALVSLGMGLILMGTMVLTITRRTRGRVSRR